MVRKYGEKQRLQNHKSRAVREYGLTAAQYDSLKDHCEICGSKHKLVIDHDHTLKIFRGRLCRDCNLGLGMFKDSRVLLYTAARYIERNF